MTAERTKALQLPTLLILNKMDLWHGDNKRTLEQYMDTFLKKCTRDDTGKLSCFSVSYLEPSSIMKVLRWITQEESDSLNVSHAVP